MKTYKYDSEIVDLLELMGTPIKLDTKGYCRDIEADWIRENPFNILSETEKSKYMNETTKDEVKTRDFRKELEKLINIHGYDDHLNIPDFIIVEYIILALDALNVANKQNARWHGWSNELDSNLEIN